MTAPDVLYGALALGIVALLCSVILNACRHWNDE
jgi:hypothetical protein